MKMNKLLCVLAGAFALSCGAAQANNMENDEYNGWFNGSGLSIIRSVKSKKTRHRSS